MPEQPIPRDDWDILTISDFLGGQVLNRDSELLENNETLKLTNLVMRKGRVQKDTGSQIIHNDILFGNPRKVFRHILRSGTIELICVTDQTVYRSQNNQWRVLSGNTTTTTLNGNHTTGNTTLVVVSSTGFSPGQIIGIVLDNGTVYATTVSTVPNGTSITIPGPGLPSAAANGNSVYRAVTLAGIATKHITGETLPWNDWLVFTNAVNIVQRYDPSVSTVVNLPGLPSSGNVIAETLVLFDNSLIIGGLTEGGTNFPTRIRYSAKGDTGNWTTLEAGTTDYLEKQARILQLLKLGPFLIAYRTKAITRIGISRGTTRRFESDTVVMDHGVFSNIGVVDLVDRHFCWFNNGFYWYSGGFSVEKIPCDVESALFGPESEVSDSNRQKCHVVHVEPFDEILGFYQLASGTGPAKAFRFSLEYNTWKFRIFPGDIWGTGERVAGSVLDWDDLIGDWIDQIGDWNSYSTFGSLESLLLCAGNTDIATDQSVYDYNFLANNDFMVGVGTPIAIVLETKDFSHPNKMLRHDYLELRLAGGTIITDYSTDKGESWINLGTIVANATIRKYRLFRQFLGSTIRFRFTSSTGFTITAMNMRYLAEFEW